MNRHAGKPRLTGALDTTLADPYILFCTRPRAVNGKGMLSTGEHSQGQLEHADESSAHSYPERVTG